MSSFKKKENRKWKPSNCQCQCCIDFLDGIGFTNRITDCGENDL